MEKTEGKGRHRMENSTGSSTGNSTENNTGRFIAQRRKSLGMTQRQLAEQLGVTNKAVSKWETGQGMPDVGTLLELSRVLQVTVDELLEGRMIEKEETGGEARLIDIAAKRAEKKLADVHVGAADFAGAFSLLLALFLLTVQVWYLIRGRSLGFVYLTHWIPVMLAEASVVLLWAGGACIVRLRPFWIRGRTIAAAGILFVLAIVFSMVCFRTPGREIVSLSPDLSNVMCLKVDDSGRAVFYRQRGIVFAAQADVFPFTVKDRVKVQWLEDDVCALTYESSDDGNTHQYAATYGDRNGGVSYYYVFNAVNGVWRAEGNYGDYVLEVTDGPDAGIELVTPEGTEHYDVDECLQYGTLALVFPSDDPKWTLVLNRDCVLSESGAGLEEGGTLTLCRVSMDRTAPLIMQGK